MQTFIVRVYRVRPGIIGPVSGIVEDIVSGHKTAFQNFDELETVLSHSIAKGQQGFPDCTLQELDTPGKLAVTG